MRNKIEETLIIKIELCSEHDSFEIDIYGSEAQFEEQDPIDGGFYEGEDMKGALEMAADMAQDLIKRDKTDEPT